MTREVYQRQVALALEMFDRAGIPLTAEERSRVEVVDWGLNTVETQGLQIITYVNTERVCAKEMVLLPYQTCAEHKHIPTMGMQGKEETFRCRYGKVYLYVEGEGRAEDIQARMPDFATSVYHEVVLEPGDQYTIMPETWHWFQAGADGAVISEFSTTSTDQTDIFTDKRLVRATVITD